MPRRNPAASGAGRLARAAAVGLLLAVAAWPASAQMTPGLQDDPYAIAYDYWTRNDSRAAWEQVRNVERYHLADENFWKEYREGHLTEARLGLVFVLKYVPNHPQGLYLLGVVSRQMNETSYPIPYFERALRLYPGHAYTRAQYGQYLGSIGQRQAAIRELREASFQDPNCTVAKAWLLDLTSQGKPEAPPKKSPNVRP